MPIEDFAINVTPGRLLVDYHTTIVQCFCRLNPPQILTIVGYGAIICGQCHKLWQTQPKEGGGVNLLMTPPNDK